jgi:hypothetical protein
VKYMIMMFGSAAQMGATASPEWIKDMIGFMVGIDKELTDTGELVFQAGLTDGSQARVVSFTNGQAAVTDGPFAESKESLIGYWVLDVESDQRILDIAGRIAVWAGRVEVRAIADGPPDV